MLPVASHSMAYKYLIVIIHKALLVSFNCEKLLPTNKRNQGWMWSAWNNLNYVLHR